VIAAKILFFEVFSPKKKDCSEKHDRFSAVAPKITLNTLAVETGI
jgi:hypothetical protein